MKKLICYYHNDMDGIASAAIVKKAYSDWNCKFVDCQYGDEIGLFLPSDGFEKCFIVDFSFSDLRMNQLHSEYGKNLCWIDHHKTAKEQLSTLWNSEDIDGLRSLDKAACELTWEWFFPHTVTPMAIQYIGDWDTWKFKYGDKTKFFFEYICASVDLPEDNLWDLLLSDNLHERTKTVVKCIPIGAILMQAKQKRIEKSFEDGSTIMFEGHKCIVINSNHDISNLGEYGYKDNNYPIALIWSVRGGKVIFSLRSNTIDVGKIAEKHGGGGHKFAAGFEGDIMMLAGLHKEVKI